MRLRVFQDIKDDEINNNEGKDADYETDTGVENGVAGFFSFTGVTGGCHITDPTDNNPDDGDEAGNADDTVENVDYDIR